MAKERHTVAFVLGAALGGAVGAVFGLMNAPRPGVETRAELTERWHDVEERAAQEIANLEIGGPRPRGPGGAGWRRDRRDGQHDPTRV